MHPNHLLPHQLGSQNNGDPLAAAAMPDSVNGETQQSMQMYQHHLLSGGLSQYQPSGTMKPGSFLARQQPENYGCILHHQNMSSSLAQAAMPTETAFDSTLMQRQHFNSANPTVNLPFPADLSSLGGSVATSSAADALAKGAAAGTQSGEQAGNDESELVSKKRAKQNNDRNEHARSARERKKAYILKLRLLAERLHAERNEEAEKQRESIQQSTEVKRVRCKVVQTFLRYHSLYESDEQKWNTILEGDFCLKQPVTPFRSFRRAEIDKDVRLSQGVQAVIRDSASLSVMIEVIGHLNHRWMQMKREEFMALEESYRRSKRMPRCIKHQISRLQHAISSLSSDSDDREHETSSKVMKKPKIALLPTKRMLIGSKMTTEKSFSNSGRAHKSSSCNVSVMNMRDASRDLHDYNAKPLPDPMINYLERSSGSSLFGYLKLDGNDSKQSSNPDFLSRDDANALALTQPKIGPVEKCSGNGPSDLPDVSSGNGGKRSTSIASSSGDYPAMKDSHDLKQSKAGDMEDTPSKAGNLTSLHEDGKLPRFVSGVISTEFSNNGGMTHSVSPIEHGAESLSAVLSYVLPHFSELGNRSVPSVSAGSSYGLKTEPESRDPLSVQSHTESSIRSSNNLCPKSLTDMTTDLKQSASRNEAVLQNSADYHVNEDSMILMGNVLMCSFMFRSHDAVRCGARDECVIPGMLQARFSAGNKLQSIDFSYDALGFMQQLAKASGNDITAHIVPGSVEMALTPSSSEARVITMAQPPYLIMYVNEVWTRTTGYSLMDVEGKEYLRLLEGEGTIPEAKDRPGKPSQKLEEVAKGMPACSTNIHYGKDGHDFIEFVCSYPLANERDEITHILHVSQELPSSIRECEFF